jgi:HAMP domain-containing protein
LRSVVGGGAGLAGSILLVLVFTGYLSRVIVLPVRRAAGMTGRLAGGDLEARLPETSAGEIGELERAFNTMGGSLETSRDELTRVLEEQAALRRVATLVARGIPPVEIFSAVAEEIGRLLGRGRRRCRPLRAGRDLDRGRRRCRGGADQDAGRDARGTP